MILKINEEKEGLKLLQVEGGLVVVNLKQLCRNNHYSVTIMGKVKKFVSETDRTIWMDGCPEIIYASPEIGIEEIPPIGDIAYSLAVQRYKEQKTEPATSDSIPLMKKYIFGFIEGYRKSQHISFTEDAVREALFEAGRTAVFTRESCDRMVEELIDSLKQPRVEIIFVENKHKKAVLI